MASTAKPGPVVKAKGSAKRDQQLDIEASVQKAWSSAQAFEAEPAGTVQDKDKFFVTFPYPYMNGVLHLGHAFSLSKAEFAARFQRMLGKKILFPFGFHCTGMPIVACADRLAKELKQFGNPPQFPAEEEDEVEDAAAAAAEEAAAADGEEDVKKRKKAKNAAKTSTLKYQYQIMQEMGVPEAEIYKFTDANFWLQYFPPIGQADLEKFGLAADFRRSFITTDINPYYDSFIRWQFNTLGRLGKLSYGKRYAIWSPIDNQPCADHDRASGEGVGFTEYTLIKLKLQKPYPAPLQAMLEAAGLADKEVLLPAATLRPETMYGQTNLFMLPTGEYGVYQLSDTEVMVCSDRSALNLSWQEHMNCPAGQPQKLGSVMGAEFMGFPVKAPLAQFPQVYILPLLTIKMNKGTGVVTSVPSDAPDDWAALMDLKNKAALRKKFNILEEHVMPFDPVPIIDTPGLGDLPAPSLCKERKVVSQNDADKLAEIKKICYRESFDHGVMKVGPFVGTPVKEAKVLIRQQLIAEGQALAYAEPEGLIMSRSGNECVVALTNQWYLEYGKGEWQAQVKKHIVEKLETFGPATKRRFRQVIDWLHAWACSRGYGLGTRMPQDESFVIESLSDSTIYMAYYTIAHKLQGNLEGSVPGTAGIQAQQLTDAVWDYIFQPTGAAAEYPADCGVPQATLDELRAEFRYWYPMDLRVSGKDLIQNHLTMCLYNHAAIWEDQPEQCMPRGVYANGFVLINSQKMSKSTGNFKTVEQAVQEYSADATRFALAEAGDSLLDSNFSELVANSHILRLSKELDWIKEVVTWKPVEAGSAAAAEVAADAAADPDDPTALAADIVELREGPPTTFFDKVFENEINVCIRNAREAFEGMQFRVATQWAVHELLNARDQYRLACQGSLNRQLVERLIDVLVLMWNPVCPHWCQWVHQEVLGREGLLMNQRWPEAGPVDRMLQRKAKFLAKVDHAFNQALRNHNHKVRKSEEKAKKAGREFEAKFPTSGVIYTAETYPGLQVKLIQITQRLVNEFLAKEAANDAGAAEEEEESKDSDESDEIAAAAPAKPKEVIDRGALSAALKELEINKKEIGAAMKFCANVAQRFTEIGEEAWETVPAFDETAFLQENLRSIEQHAASLSRAYDRTVFGEIRVEAVPQPDQAAAGSDQASARPGEPSFRFFL